MELSKKKSGYKYMKKKAFACCLGILGILTTEFGVIGILPQIAAYYHISIDKAGLLLSASPLLPTLLHSAYFASAIAAVISVADKKDQHRMMSIAGSCKRTSHFEYLLFHADPACHRKRSTAILRSICSR